MKDEKEDKFENNEFSHIEKLELVSKQKSN
jgi:hypothetical protein